jgi:hypothetical protein
MIHSPLLNVPLLPSYLTTHFHRSSFQEGRVQDMGDIVVVFWFPLIIGGMLLVIMWAMNSVP